MFIANANWCMLLRHLARRPYSRADAKAGSSSASNAKMMDTTTISSTMVKPRFGPS